MPVYTLPMSAKSIPRTALGCALGLAVILAGALPARAGDSDDVAPDIKLLQRLLEGIGLKSGRERDIDYRERSPLVIPPSNALLPPETDTIARNPNWPVDQEVKRAKEARAAERNRPAGDSSDEFRRDSAPVPIDEMMKGPKRNSPRDAGGTQLYEGGQRLSPSELGTKRGLFGGIFDKSDDDKAAQFTGEPPRANLTDPPAGYQTPSPNERYGQTKEIYRPKAEDSYGTHGDNIGRN